MLETDRRPDGQQGLAEEFVEHVKDRHKPWFVLRKVLDSPGIAYESLRETCAAVGMKAVKATVRNLSTHGLIETIEAENGRFVTVTPDGCWAAHSMGLLDKIGDEIQPAETADHPKPERRGKFRVTRKESIEKELYYARKGENYELLGALAKKVGQKRDDKRYPEQTVASLRRKQDARLAEEQIEEGLGEAENKLRQYYEMMDNAYSIADALEEAENPKPVFVRTFPINSQPPTIADLDGKINQLQ